MSTTKQNQMIAGRMVEFQNKFSSLSNDDAQFIIQHAGEAIFLFNYAIANRAELAIRAAATILSKNIGAFTVPATINKFIAKDKFKVDTRKQAKVKISSLGDEFSAWFLDKVEYPHLGSIIVSRKLKKDSDGVKILAGLGGDEAAKITLTEMWAAIEAQPNGENGNLRNTGWANIFYIEDVNGTLRAVSVRWSCGGWRVEAHSVDYQSKWVARQYVFSRNSDTSDTQPS